MKIEVEVKGMIDEAIFVDYNKQKLAENYNNGTGIYAVMDKDLLCGFVIVNKFLEAKEGEPKRVNSMEFILPPDSLANTAKSKMCEHLSIQFSEAVCKVSDIVSTDKEMMKGIIKHIDDKLQEIAGNRGNGISEKTLLEALKIVGNKECK